MGWIILIIIGYFVISAIAESDENYTRPIYGPKDFETKPRNNRTHADWVKESAERDKKIAEEYDRMWADEWLDEHD